MPSIFVMENSRHRCWCAGCNLTENDINTNYDRHAEGTCSQPCAGDSTYSCGGDMEFSLYQTISCGERRVKFVFSKTMHTFTAAGPLLRSVFVVVPLHTHLFSPPSHHQTGGYEGYTSRHNEKVLNGGGITKSCSTMVVVHPPVHFFLRCPLTASSRVRGCLVLFRSPSLLGHHHGGVDMGVLRLHPAVVGTPAPTPAFPGTGGKFSSRESHKCI